jgi:DNA-binding MarR family transcriptional regulator/N-acetylglutamate synthase-like GNAT family acetyltransferase
MPAVAEVETPGASAERVAAMREFNRFYTRRIGVLEEGLLDSPFSLAEVRILYELAHHDGLAASGLAADLSLDAGYLSRILQRLSRSGLVTRTRLAADARVRPLALTAKGKAAFAPLDRRSQRQVAALLGALPVAAQDRLLNAMRAIEALLADKQQLSPSCALRAHRPGDMGWVIERHGALYAQEYGWDESFEALVAEIAAKFIREFDPGYERCWIAECEGQRAGSVFLVRKSATVAKLRLLIVDPTARGMGVGRQLVDACVDFARDRGYRKLTLWTQDNLQAARHIYKAAGFTCVRREKHTSFGRALVGETWDLDLRPASRASRKS